MAQSPIGLCMLSLFFLIANSADSGVNILIFKMRELNESVGSTINQF